jgi:hypothetical protein
VEFTQCQFGIGVGAFRCRGGDVGVDKSPREGRFLVTQGPLRAVEDGTVTLTDEQAIEGLTRFIYRGLTGRDY